MGFKHVAIIMDGNGRWAKAQHQQRTFGHLQGSEKVREIAIAANEKGLWEKLRGNIASPMSLEESMRRHLDVYEAIFSS